MQGLYAVGVAGVALGIARAMLDAFMALAVEKTPRGLQRLADNPVVQSDVARHEAALGSARAYLVEILKDVLGRRRRHRAARARPTRVRVRLGCAQAIRAAVDVADYVYKAAGTSAIFLGTPFERRFRDIHTLSQQIQSREAHFETVGRVMFNGDPERGCSFRGKPNRKRQASTWVSRLSLQTHRSRIDCIRQHQPSLVHPPAQNVAPYRQ